ncbi:cell division protein SepF [Heliophilum fasciatum]|uniref:Cell division protein SepF n=1 Tax=Heliophilum fasciatum TaxID=35700 RepID=A0A4V2SWI9_9FIRM|nr:cell division protein SepF [Heliophilum fasciatum]MCW2278882.1 cell division inhibitor SepF [Heliophilum fasciatum]TCP62106.1 cell division inhibitor SepF [Heliophilum fasciatum]
MAKIMDKIYNIIGMSDEYEEFVESVETPKAATVKQHNQARTVIPVQTTPPPQEEKEIPFPPRRNPERSAASVVNLSAERQKKEHKVVVIVPKAFEDAMGIVDHLKDRRQVVLNLEKIDKEMARWIIHFVSGATYALGGSQEKVGTNIFIFAPSNIDIIGDIKKEDSPLRATLSWMTNG